MKTRTHAFWLRCLWLWLLLGGAATLSATAAPTLDGLWKGPLKVPGGQLEVVFRLVSLTGGSYFATLDVPLQKVSQIAVAVEIKGDTVIFAAEEAGSSFVGRLASGGKQIDGVWRQPGYQSPLTLTFTAAAINTAPKARLTPPYREEEVVYSNIPANLRLAGMLTVPAGAGPFPAVVLLSDAGAHDRDGTVGTYRMMGILGDYLTRRGIAVLRFDDRGTGSSTGDLARTTIAELVSDVQASLNFLRTRPEINLAQIGVIGHGEGGNVALLSATQPLPPAFVVTLAAYGVPGNELAVQQQAALLRSLGTEQAQIDAASKRQKAMLEIVRQTPDEAQAKAIVANMLRQNNTAVDGEAAQASAAELTSFRYRYFLGFDPLKHLEKVKCPVLLLNGTADLYVAAESNLTALTKTLRGNRDMTSKKLPGVNHLFQSDPAEWPLVNGQPRETFSPATQEIIRSWIVARTGGGK
ncbi:alpha/beta hydrolase family protein [Hymenobacter sediminicola]|uniref:Alpha/beta fold hydrolase n=1 Tax=Hymenobacter sediminicola TaxID=2761579 RepID=A0A7G7W6C2_9BACT|nr:alpha/beta fold hydrolase [Hymenobacter sediminicola]QNH61915.1 alpha/beta fold hydrolase [Hymenobacter sediminicola]